MQAAGPRRAGATGPAALVAACVAPPFTAAGVSVPAGPARAAASCPNAPPAGQELAGVPWAQQRYAPERLAGLATGRGSIIAVID